MLFSNYTRYEADEVVAGVVSVVAEEAITTKI
jgi:hypothetical protein